MQFSWVKSSLKLFDRANRKVFFLTLLSFLLSTSIANAALTVSPTRGSLSPSTTGGGGFYYYVGTPVISPAFMQFIPLGIIQTFSSEYGNPLLPNMFEISVLSNSTFSNVTGTQQLVVTFQANPLSDPPRPLAIAAVNGIPCNDSICQARDQIPGHTPSYYYAAKYYPSSNAPIKIGFYPQDICVDTASQGGVPGCTAGAVTPPTSGVRTTFSFSFFINAAPDSNPTTVPTGTALDTLTTPVIVSLQVDIPQFVCPDQTTLFNAYTPGDSQASFNIGVLQMANSAYSYGYYIVGNEDIPPVVDATFATANSIIIFSPPVNYQTIVGLSNSTNLVDHFYNISFIGQDQTGIFAPPLDPLGSGSANASGCLLPRVQVASIQGFLGKSSCFIASAAFGSGDAIPVLLLRKFRDQVLLNSGVGRGFVSWYYGWSPSAAGWLLENPVFRLPVLLVLVPFEGVAWAFLHPVLAGVSSIFLIIFGIIILRIIYYRKGISKHINKSIRRRVLFFFLLLPLFSASASSAEKSLQPYIDQLKSEATSESSKTHESLEAAPQELDPYIQSIRKNSNFSKPGSMSGQPYIESLKKGELKDPEKSEDAESYTQKEKERLGTQEQGGAIKAVEEGRSQLEVKRVGAIRHTFGFRYGISISRAITAAPGIQLRAFNDVYGGSYTPDISFFYEFQPFHHEIFGNLGIVGMGGLAYFRGVGAFSINLPLLDGSGNFYPRTSSTLVQFYSVPITIAVNYRFNLFKYVRPYILSGPTLIGYMETRSDNISGNRGNSRAFLVSAGVYFLLDWISSKNAWDLYSDFSVKHFYLTLDYSKFFTLSGDVNFAISGITTGFAFEF